jgi:hypothetical protein
MIDGKRASWFVLGTTGMALFVLVLYVVLQAAQTTHAIRDTQNTNTQINVNQTRLIRKVAQVSRQIQSCTTPGKPCYQDGQRRTGEAVSNIGRSSIAAAVCVVKIPAEEIAASSRSELIDTIAACVVAQLSHEQQNRKR